VGGGFLRAKTLRVGASKKNPEVDRKNAFLSKKKKFLFNTQNFKICQFYGRLLKILFLQILQVIREGF
jgi:hypothetical protein